MSRRVRKYSIAIKDVEDLYKEQLGLCAICSKDMTNDYHIDHNHTTGKVRGLLCRICNLGLGYIEKEDWLDKAVKYLETEKILKVV